jgi:hypothetical protein
MMTGDLIEFVRSVELFQGVDVEAYARLARELKICELKDREVLALHGPRHGSALQYF